MRSRTFNVCSLIRATKIAPTLALSLIVVGCGGGSGSTSSSSATWAAQAYVKASNAGNWSDLFGNSVAISGDTIVVGAYLEDSSQTTITNGSTSSSDTSAGNSGAAYVYVRSGSTWSQQAYLKAPNTDVVDLFGSSVAISGDTIVVGAPQESSNQTTITNGTSASSDNSASSAGAAYVFVRNGNSWSQQAYLKAPNADANDNFGTSVAISGDTIVVGAHQESSDQTTITNGTGASNNNSATNSGAAYVFARSGSNWTQQAYLKAPNSEANDYFGLSVAISDDTILIGAYGEDSNQTTITNGASANLNNSATNSGAAYVYIRTSGVWSQQAYLKASNADSNDLFGLSVAISGNTIVVGAYGEDSSQTTITNGGSPSSNNSLSNAGAAYVFVRTGSIWTQQAYLKAPNGDIDDYFGFHVAISDDTIVVGASSEDSSQTSTSNGESASADNSAVDSGAAYVFVRSGNNWSQQAYLKAANAESNDQFGRRVAVSGNTVVVGAHQEDSSQNTITNGTTASADNSGSDTGAVYVFKRN